MPRRMPRHYLTNGSINLIMITNIRQLLGILKKIYKKHLFIKYADCGENLTVGQGANISIEKGSSIKIGHDCDILSQM